MKLFDLVFVYISHHLGSRTEYSFSGYAGLTKETVVIIHSMIPPSFVHNLDKDLAGN